MRFFAQKGLFRGIESVIEVQLVPYDLRGGLIAAPGGQGLVPPATTQAGPLQPALGLLDRRLDRGDLASDGTQLMLERALLILRNGDLGDLAGELGIPVDGLGGSWS